MPASLRRSPSSDQLAQRGVAASQPREQLRGAQRVGDGPAGLGQEPAYVVEVAIAHVEDVDEADHLVGAHQRDGATLWKSHSA